MNQINENDILFDDATILESHGTSAIGLALNGDCTSYTSIEDDPKG